KLKNEAGQVVGEAKTTNKDGVVKFENLVPGKYTLEEMKAPEGYKALEVTVEVNVVANEVVKQEVTNEKVTGQFEIVKVDAEDKTRLLSGAEFEVYKDGKKVAELKTDESGKVMSPKLPLGEYTVKETKAPEGYELTKQIIHVTVDGEKVIDVKVTNGKSLGQFEIVKVDAQDKTKVLSDAEFEVYKDGKKVDTLRTDKTGKVVSQKLEPGKYTLKETKAPQGYKLLKEEIEVVVEADKVVEVQIENAKELGSLQVIKKDAESGKVLAGAEFKLKNEADQVVGEAKTTNKDGVVKFESLVPGKYTLEETKAPEGYKALEVTVEVNVVANEVVKQEVMNEKVKEEITGQLEITKVDANNTNKTLAGAVFEIWKDGIKIDTLTTNKSGKATSKKLEPGDYTLKEIQAPEGYTLSDKEMKFTISNEKIEVVKLQITNKKDTDKDPEKPGEGTEKPDEGTGKPGEGVEKPNLPEQGQGSSNNQQLPATGHDTNYVPFIGFMLLLLGIRLRFMAKNS
ncbi:SpaA isopeptide-forming pilin-related protein, partial [Bacillus cereus]|uniref:MSCRAMM family protein n=1 Tax=Bacillus cereus TaxID=1396 RepID=UPI002AC0B100